MLGEPILAPVAGQLGIATRVVPDAELAQTVEAMVQKLAIGPTKSYAATRRLLKAWSFGGVPAADAEMLEVVTNLFSTEDCTRGFLSRAEAIDRGVQPRGNHLQQPVRRGARPSDFMKRLIRRKP
jgi:enoyl-CoA hydratase/carnithine racemase